MGWHFNQPIDLPPGLTHLTMDHCFSQPIDLPPGLTQLIMGYFFNQPVALPPRLTHLKMGWLFNQPIDLPPGLTHLAMGYYHRVRFNQPINLPTGLQVFEAPARYEHLITSQLKTQLLHCNCGDVYIHTSDRIQRVLRERRGDHVRAYWDARLARQVWSRKLRGGHRDLLESRVMPLL